MYRFIRTKESSESNLAENKRNREVADFIAQSNIGNLIISNEPVEMTRDEVMAEKGNRSRGDGVTAPVVWKVMLEDAIASYSIKQYTSAISELTKAIESSSRNPYLYMNRSAVSAEMMEFVQSIGSSGQRFVIEADKSKELHTTERVFDFNNAIFDINTAISLNPNVAYFYYNRANVYVLSGDMPQAIADYTKAIEMDSKFGAAYYNRGLVQIYLKESKKGFLDLSRAGELGLVNAYEVIKKYMENEK